DFYFRGRAGVLGEVDAATVTAEMGFFQPGTVAANWDTARDVMSAGEAATAVVVKAGNGTAEFFGWAAPHPDPEPARATWQAAEDATDEQVAATLAVLDETEQATLVRLLTGAA
ncbi:MAG: helix-turn-helix domain-containing protein, partial [Microthrixaceae bacterium]